MLNKIRFHRKTQQSYSRDFNPNKGLCEEVIKNVYQVVKFFQISWIDDDGYCPISNYQDAIATDNYEAIISNKKA